MRALPVIATIALCSTLTARSATPEDAPAAPEAAYRAAVTDWHDAWQGRPRMNARDEGSCIEAWQTGDRVRTKAAASTPPARFAAFHEALLRCMEACLKVSDECLVKPNGGPRFSQYFIAARRTCRDVTARVTESKLDLPHDWF